MKVSLVLFACSLLLFACALPSLAPAPAHVASGTALFQDNFSSPGSGWDHIKYAEGIMDYDRGGYRMLVNTLNANFWSTPHKDFSDVRLEVDAGKLGGPDENRLGLICRSDGSNYYFFIISSDGYYGLGLFDKGKAVLLGQSQMQASQAIHTGASVNHLRLDCKGDALTVYVNGSKLAEAHDATLKHGDIGLLAGTFNQPGADIVFDNFVALAP